MDPEATIATLWMLVGVAGPAAMIYVTALLVGLEVTSTVEFVISMGVVVASMVWMGYCTWRIRLVSMTPDPGLDPAVAPDVEEP